jgi:outer membrane murein-binding lipoprotein Lpp
MREYEMSNGLYGTYKEVVDSYKDKIEKLTARVAELEAENERLKNNIEFEALKAEIAAMEEDNKTREGNGYAHAWPGQTFFEVAKKMRELKGSTDGK